jgi:hypothetical protein
MASPLLSHGQEDATMDTAIIDLTALIIPFAVCCVGFAGIVFAGLFTFELWSGPRSRPLLGFRIQRPTVPDTFRSLVRSRVAA